MKSRVTLNSKNSLAQLDSRLHRFAKHVWKEHPDNPRNRRRQRRPTERLKKSDWVLISEGLDLLLLDLENPTTEEVERLNYLCELAARRGAK